ncbi:CHASE2 domain-containing protein [Marinobacterium arenosum]|uniref:CHASE2 domain-containing protein n=1 Tax=Marinobacterium arenosum TaxID=2862496 RepID=UPI001C97F23B|nr:adenylate/guanylate cyclase domain-containing protein [Marinobacterium arenosum]MBY4676312.1 adenylate/guanylate cyclase domain-containing protein [Marinobacterium arenosum]
MKQRLIRTLVGLGVTLLVLYSVWNGSRPELAERFELDLYDLRLKHSLVNEVDPRIVIVDIDEASMAEEGRWPWNRRKLALLLEQLVDHYQVALVGFDMVFSEPNNQLELPDLQQALRRRGNAPVDAGGLQQLADSLDPDRRFARAISERPVVMGFVFDRADSRLKVGEPGNAVLSDDHLQYQLPIPRASGVLGNLAQLQQATPWGGFFDNPLVDGDGTYRRVPLLQQYQERYYPSLALGMFLALFGESSVTPILESDSTGSHWALSAVEAGGVRIPVDEHSAVLVPYRGGMGSFPYISAADVLHGRADRGQLEGTIVLVGTSAAGLLDLRVTPMQNRYPGVEIHANILSGMLDERIRHQPDYTRAVELVQLLVTGLLLSILVPHLSVLRGSLLAAGWALLVVVANLYAWNELLWVIPLGYTLLLIVLLFLFQQVTGYFFETRNRMRLASQFGQYIPAEIVDELNAHGKPVALQGESREMTVFFSDVRGFTGLSEQLTPQQLTRLMNLYLTHMTRIIYRHRGTVDKYIGDAVMAFWGAPLEDDQHARLALDAALAMDLEMPLINRELADEGLPAINVGMGLNSGLMNVGNMGSSYRMAYTVMGDAVNLGSRLEGLTKFYGVPIIVSGELAARVPEYLFLELDRVQVKGRSEPVTLYQPLGLRDTVAESVQRQVEQVAEAMASYREQNWDRLQQHLNELEQQGFNATLIELYRSRLAIYRQNPPPADWDGVFVHTSK